LETGRSVAGVWRGRRQEAQHNAHLSGVLWKSEVRNGARSKTEKLCPK
jgi:hypothetical protein